MFNYEDEQVSAKIKNVCVQTVERESYTQTDPYSPDYIVEPGSEPEILSIQNLTWGQGLPASKTEMEIIELTREKRAFEFALPPTSDEGNFNLRRKLMEHQETLEWLRREEEIKKIQNERLELLNCV
jgi:hypothetical protein